MWATQVTDAGLAHLTQLSGLTKLNLDQTSVSDAGLVHIGKLTGLKSLVLSATQITDDGVSHLFTLKELEDLYVEFCSSLGGSGKQLIRENLPQVVITE